MKHVPKTIVAGAAGISAALASALCCAGPLLAVAAGLSGAGMAATFEPLRPYFLGATAGFLLLGFWTVDREDRNACESGARCADPQTRRRMKIVLWIATVAAVIFATLPSWLNLLL